MNKQQNTKLINWSDIARPEQKLPSGKWWLWLLLAGRGFGKTRTGAESLMELVNSGKYKNIAIIGKTINEVRDIMVEGVTGVLSTSVAKKMFHNEEKKIEDSSILKFKYLRSKNSIIWENGAQAYFIGGDNYEKLRGYQFDLIWIDEFAKYKHPEALWEQVLFTLRMGDDPKCIMTTTPKPLKILKQLSESSETYLTKGSTFDNKKNLSPIFIETMLKLYNNTRIGKQELEGEILMEKENTVWKKENIVYRDIERNKLSRVVIGVDPAVTSGENSDETGIIVAGVGYDDKIYILDDLSGKYKPPEWAKIVCRASHDYDAGRIVAETNNGGDLVREMLTTIYPYVPFKQTHAIKGKIARAEPISLLYDSNKVYHTREFFELEEQMCNLSYDDKMEKSPDRVDALVWALSELKDRETVNLSAIYI
ncbi:MAG: phage terminase large subunit [Holosporales bacterium]|jgi:phage terminase large subunit-like protein|nr:phage terminase large subunit [Holosporales bacterium]